MNFIRKFLVLILLVLLTSCASEMGNQDENVKQEQDKINKLNEVIDRINNAN